MAFVRNWKKNQNNKQEEQQPGAPVQITTGPVGSSAPAIGTETKNVVPQAATVSGAPQQQVGTRSGYFTDLQKYIQGNREGAEKLGEQIAGRIGTERQEAETAYGTLGKQFETEFAAGMPKWDTNVVNRVLNAPEVAIKEPETMKQFEKIRSGQYTGPAGLAETTGYQEALKELQDITDFSQLAQTSGGRKELIRQIPGYNLASSGGLSLDQLLLQNVKPALQRVTSEAEAGLPLKEQFEKKVEDTSKWVVPAQQIAEQNKQRLEKELLGARETLEQQIQSSVQSKIAEEKAREQRIRDLLAATAPKVKVPQAPAPEVTPREPMGMVNPFEGRGTMMMMEPGMGSQMRASAAGGPVMMSTGDEGRIRATNQGMPAPAPKGMTTAEMVNLYAAEPERFNENLETIEKGGTPVTQGQLDLLGLTREQWDNLATLRNQAAEAGISFDLQNYLTPQSPEALYTPETVMTQEQRNRLNALRQLQGMTPIESRIPEAAKPYLFDIAGASEALQSQLGSVKATEREAELKGELDQMQEQLTEASKPKKPKKPSSTESTVQGALSGAAIGAQVGGPVGAVIGGAIGGLVGNITCFAAGTPILMADGSMKKVENLDLLDQLYLGGKVIGKGVSLSNFIYHYKGNYMDGSHVVYEDGKWLKVSDSELATQIPMEDNKFLPVYPIVCEHHVMMSKGFISGDMVLVDDAWDLTETQRIEALNNNTELNKTLDDVLEQIDV